MSASKEQMLTQARIDKDPVLAYRLFLFGAYGHCCECGATKAASWCERQTIEGGPHSQHEMLHFIRFQNIEPNQPSLMCDTCLDKAISNEEVELYYSDLNGPANSLSDQAMLAVYELGRSNMEALLMLHGSNSKFNMPLTELRALMPLQDLQDLETELPELRDWISSALGYFPDELGPETLGRFDALVDAAVRGFSKESRI